jgi:hypothetical protein
VRGSRRNHIRSCVSSLNEQVDRGSDGPEARGQYTSPMCIRNVFWIVSPVVEVRYRPSDFPSGLLFPVQRP